MSGAIGVGAIGAHGLGINPAAGGWTPESISGLKAWLNASRITGIADGGTVTTWTDLTGNGNSPTQATAGKRPLYKANIINGQAVVRGDGSDDFLIMDPVAGGTIAQPLTIFVACQFIALGTGDSRTIFDGGAVDRCVLYRKPEASPTWYYYGGSAEVDCGDAADTNPHYFVCIFNGASSSIRMDGTEIHQGSPGTEGMEDILLFENIAYTAAANLDIAEFGIYDSAVSGNDLTNLELYLASQYGI